MNKGTMNTTGLLKKHRATVTATLMRAALTLGVLAGSASVFNAQQTTTLPPSTQQLQVPAIASDFRSEQKPLPQLGRVGVDMERQRPLSLREALTSALENNKDIEVARQNVKIAEFELLGSRGAYDPRLSSSSYFERIKSPISSFLSGGSNGSITQNDFTNTARLEGLSPKVGGSYRLDFSSIRLTTDNQFTGLSPQYPTALTFNYT